MLRSKNGRKFLKLCFRYGSRPRFKKFRLKFYGRTILVPDALSFIWQFHDIYFLESYKFLTDANSPVIYDLGANIGLASIYFRQQHPEARIVAFEPNPNVYSDLKENTESKNIEIHQKAIWKEDGFLEIGMNPSDDSSIHSTENVQKVPCVGIGNLLANEAKVDLLKIDIEGAEVEVLNSCRNQLGHVQNVFVEYHSYHNDSQKLSIILSILEESGFRYFIRDEKDRKSPLLNHYLSNESQMDMRLNIYAYRS